MRRARVAGIELPPSRDEVPNFMENFGELWGKISIDDGFSSKGEYLHWNDFKYRTSSDVDNKFEAWRMLKTLRHLQDHDNLVDHEGLPFRSCTPKTIQGKLFKISRLSKTENILAGIPNLARYLADGLRMEEAISSAQLEGAATTRKEAKKMLENDLKPRDYSEQMILNNWHLIREAEKQKDEPLSVDLICSFNRIATANASENEHEAGMVRNSPVYIKDIVTGDTIYEGPPFKHVNKMLEMICDYANETHAPGTSNFIDPIVKAIVIHFMIGWIHPFLDGNGRTARSLFYWFSLKSGYESIRYVSISALLKQAPKRYVSSYVYTETDENDLTYFIDYQLDIIIRAMERFQDHVKKQIRDITKSIESLSKSPYYSRLQFQHLSILKKSLHEPGRIFTTKEIEKDFMVSATAARNYLNLLVEMKLLFKVKEGKSHFFFAPSDLKQRLKI
jgi:Fic family protein